MPVCRLFGRSNLCRPIISPIIEEGHESSSESTFEDVSASPEETAGGSPKVYAGLNDQPTPRVSRPHAPALETLPGSTLTVQTDVQHSERSTRQGRLNTAPAFQTERLYPDVAGPKSAPLSSTLHGDARRDASRTSLPQHFDPLMRMSRSQSENLDSPYAPQLAFLRSLSAPLNPIYNVDLKRARNRNDEEQEFLVSLRTHLKQANNQVRSITSMLAVLDGNCGVMQSTMTLARSSGQQTFRTERPIPLTLDQVCKFGLKLQRADIYRAHFCQNRLWLFS